MHAEKKREHLKRLQLQFTNATRSPQPATAKICLSQQVTSCHRQLGQNIMLANCSVGAQGSTDCIRAIAWQLNGTGAKRSPHVHPQVRRAYQSASAGARLKQPSQYPPESPQQKSASGPQSVLPALQWALRPERCPTCRKSSCWCKLLHEVDNRRGRCTQSIVLCSWLAQRISPRRGRIWISCALFSCTLYGVLAEPPRCVKLMTLTQL